MGFSGLEQDLGSSAFVVDEMEGRRRIELLLQKLDSSWVPLTNTTLSVMCVVLASSSGEAKDLARALLEGLLGLMGRMSDAWCGMSGGITCVVPDKEELLRESNEVDAAGQALGAKIDHFGGVLMTQLLVALPPMWTQHFKLIMEAKGLLSKQLTDNEASWLSSVIVDEQVRLTREFISKASEAFDEGSVQSERASAWSKAATEVFTTVVNGGAEGPQAMAYVIRTLGFPHAGVDYGS
jgi:hypothetical protein